jgi:hypothetical protein
LTPLDGDSLKADEIKLLIDIALNFKAELNGFLDSIHQLIKGTGLCMTS